MAIFHSKEGNRQQAIGHSRTGPIFNYCLLPIGYRLLANV